MAELLVYSYKPVLLTLLRLYPLVCVQIGIKSRSLEGLVINNCLLFVPSLSDEHRKLLVRNFKVSLLVLTPLPSTGAVSALLPWIFWSPLTSSTSLNFGHTMAVRLCTRSFGIAHAAATSCTDIYTYNYIHVHPYTHNYIYTSIHTLQFLLTHTCVFSTCLAHICAGGCVDTLV